jgi:hypothetical protein
MMDSNWACPETLKMKATFSSEECQYGAVSQTAQFSKNHQIVKSHMFAKR